MNKKKKRNKRAGKPVRKYEHHRYRKRQRSTSIYFLLWAAFSVLSLIIVLLFGLAQYSALTETYKRETVRELSEKGKRIEMAWEAPLPDAFKGDRSAYLQFLSVTYDVHAVVLDANGKVLFPVAPSGEETLEDKESYLKKIDVLKSELEKTSLGAVVYEGDNEYVYGVEVSLYGETGVYLYISKSLQLMNATAKSLGVRIILIAVFVLVLAFAVSSAVSGWLARPIAEITKKARLLAQGDFHVDFNGSDYGEEMVALADSLNFARDELSKADRMQKELIANVSHDFKTPLTMIKAYASMIMEISGDIPEKRNKHAQVIVDEADRLSSLVGDVLDLSKIRSGITAFEKRTFDVSAYLYEILSRFEYLKEMQEYTFETEIEDGLYTCADKGKIGQVLYNLIGNAVNYTGEDKKIYVQLKRIEENVFRFSVTDTGEGIKPEELPDIWDRYYRSREVHKRPVKGTGLGLSIVKTVLQIHGFVFGVESKEGEGSTFYVDFPLVEENIP